MNNAILNIILEFMLFKYNLMLIRKQKTFVTN